MDIELPSRLYRARTVRVERKHVSGIDFGLGNHTRAAQGFQHSEPIWVSHIS